MKTVFRYRLARYRGQILGWGIGLALYAMLMVQFYGTIVDQKDQFEQLIQNYPEDFMAFFGNIEAFATPSGYLGIEFFSYMPLIVGIFAVLVGSGLLVTDEESGRLDLILAHPVSRSTFYWGRLSAFVVTTLAILFLVWLGLTVPSRWTKLSSVGWIEMAYPLFSLLGVLLFLGALALLLSMLLPSRRAAAMTSGLLLVAGFLIIGLARINPDLEPVAKLSPMYYYQGGDAIDRFDVTWFVGLVVVAALFSLVAWWRFERRDIRVGGEGGWQRPTRVSLARLLPRRLGAKQRPSAP